MRGLRTFLGAAGLAWQEKMFRQEFFSPTLQGESLGKDGAAGRENRPHNISDAEEAGLRLKSQCRQPLSMG